MTEAKTVLVTGGAGYIGSHAAYALLDAGFRVVVLDDLSTGRRELVPDAAEFYQGQVQDYTQVEGVLKHYDVGSVMHFAGSVVVPESVENPIKYYRNNTAASCILLEACVALGVSNFIFSSTAAVYGTPEEQPVREDSPKLPINPYGCSKLMTEQVIRDTAKAHPLNFGILRYFNVAGADAELRTGQATPEATHLIKVAAQAITGKRAGVQVFGDDYPTPDGTGVRDYIHVSDLVEAHVVLLEHLIAGGESVTLNCGYGHGFSVLEVLDAAERVSGGSVNRSIAARRAGDPAELVADSSRLHATIDWKPRFDDLAAIISSALAWERVMDEKIALKSPS